ncbi:MAG: hypothetical protein EOO22_02470 [Comamonadaceae bacterium]|nr:MAG: hypothetical protein EOO22_02470 [Comamonadaceae bacterium]
MNDASTPDIPSNTPEALPDPHSGGDRKPANERTGVDKAMKQFSKTEAETDGRAPSAGSPQSETPAPDAGRTVATQPPASTAPSGN